MSTPDKPAMRLQVVRNIPGKRDPYGYVIPDRQILQAEVVGEFDMVQSYARAYAVARHAAQKPMGGNMISRADLPRYWDVPVGSDLR